jgi:hypothetical protein
VIFAIENSNKFQKIRFWKEKSVDEEITIVGWASQIFFRIIRVSPGHPNLIPSRYYHE